MILLVSLAEDDLGDRKYLFLKESADQAEALGDQAPWKIYNLATEHLGNKHVGRIIQIWKPCTSGNLHGGNVHWLAFS
jgi:hypothetical protein